MRVPYVFLFFLLALLVTLDMIVLRVVVLVLRVVIIVLRDVVMFLVSSFLLVLTVMVVIIFVRVLLSSSKTPRYIPRRVVSYQGPAQAKPCMA